VCRRRIHADHPIADNSGQSHPFRKVTARELGIRTCDDAECYVLAMASNETAGSQGRAGAWAWVIRDGSLEGKGDA
jgi:hypothetical protein